MTVFDRLPERETLPRDCPECNGAISQEWHNGVTDPQKVRVEGYQCVNCFWTCRIERPAVEVEQ
jgi:hypothetical protein